MQIAILSDIHDHVWNLAAALPHVRTADALVCCGDLCSPFVIDLLRGGFPGPIHIVFGNNDGDGYRMTGKADARVRMHGEFAELVASGTELLTRREFETRHGQDAFARREVPGARIAVNHFDHIAAALARGGVYHAVYFGHNHRFEVTQVGTTTLVNPGALMGYDAVQKTDLPATFVVHDTGTGVLCGYQVRARTDGVPAVSPFAPAACAPAVGQIHHSA